MFRKAVTVLDLKVFSRDGEKVGAVRDLLFDTSMWGVRYVDLDVVDRFPARKTLISPVSVRDIDWTGQTMTLGVTAGQILDSPLVEFHWAPTTEEERELAEYYGWPTYWEEFGSHAGDDGDEQSARAAPEASPEASRGALLTFKDADRYRASALDSDVGHVESLLLHFPDWIIRYMLVSTGRLHSGRRALLATDWVSAVNWKDRRFLVDLTAAQIRESPMIEPIIPLERAREEELHRHYKRSAYWEQ